MKITYKKIKKAIKNVIRKDAGYEALKILLRADEKFSKDFLKYYKKDQLNLCCLVLDSAKDDLVEKGKMNQNVNDAFGNKFIFDLNEIDLNELKDKAAKFSDEHFGKERTADLPLKKLSEESIELIESLKQKEDPLYEYADCFLVLIDSFRKYYGDDVDMQTLINACSKKLDINAERKWEYDKEKDVFNHKK